MKTTFTCSVCRKTITHESDFTTGYGERDGEKVCYACCGILAKADMLKTGKAVMYLSFDWPEYKKSWTFSQLRRPAGHQSVENGKVSNWSGTVSFPVRYVNVGRHNMAGVRYDFWFTVDGDNWHGVRYGDNTQLAHCKRIKG